jgi:dolichyl-phosphate-mannose-protein mannosyltransferase
VSSNLSTPEADVVTPESEGFPLSRPADSLARIANILALVCLAVFSVAYFVWTVRESQRGPLDTDEVFVIWIERYFTLGRITDALKLGLDTQPPPYYWMLKGFCRIFGTTALAIRLPSLIAFYAFCVSVFLAVRKRVGLVLAVFAMLFCTIAGDPTFMVRGRPYALVMACFGLACFLWLDFPQSRHQRARALLTAAVVACMVSMHFLSVIEIAALALAELLRSWQDRRIQWRYWAGLIAGASCILLWWPVIGPIYRVTHASVSAPGFYDRPSVPALMFGFFDLVKGTYLEQVLIAISLLLLPLLLVPNLLPAEVRDRILLTDPPKKDFRDLDLIAFAALTLPLLMFALATSVLGTFNTRYVVACVLGLSLLAVRGLRALKGGVLLACILLTTMTILYVNGYGRSLTVINLGRATSQRIAFLGVANKPIPIVVPSASDFFMLHESAPKDLQARISFVSVPSGVFSPDPEPELVARSWKAVRPELRVYTAEAWFSQFKNFYLLYTSDSREGLTSWLLFRAKIRVVAHQGPTWLFEMTMPDQAPAANSASSN